MFCVVVFVIYKQIRFFIKISVQLERLWVVVCDNLIEKHEENFEIIISSNTWKGEH